MTKEQLAEESLIDLAYAILEEGKAAIAFNDLVKEIQNLNGFSDAEMKSRLVQFYTDMNIDGRFLLNHESGWGLREWYKVETIEEETAPTVKARKKKSKAVIDDEDEIIGMQIDTQGEKLLFVSERGMGKRTDLDEFHVQYRGGKGVKCYKINDKTGDLVGVKAVNEDHEIMMITTEGIIIQIRMQDVSTLGRITSGVKLMNLDENVTIAQIAKVREKLSDGNEEIENLDDIESDSEVSDAIIVEEISEENE